MRVHKTLGPGLLESVYETCLFYELDQYDLNVERQKILPIRYKGVELEAGYRLDLLIDNKVIVELKAVELLNNLHTAQLLTYLRLTENRLGLLINFNSALFKNGFKRVINGTLEEIDLS
jgi:GxxExxY protein